jgi:GNAT superfamily N-acetyltransferase
MAMPARAGTEVLRRVELGAADAAAAQPLVVEAGWNQTEADWRLMLGHGGGVGLREAGALAATALALPFDGFGWISMVLVAGAWRRQGLATRLLDDRIAWLEERATVPLLDATPAGREVYRQRGFEDLWTLTRFVAAAPRLDAGTAGVRPLAREDLAAMSALDAGAFGADRSFILEDLFARAPRHAFALERGGRLAGFVLARPGRVALQIGPLVAPDLRAALGLAAAALRGVEGGVLIDVPDAREEFVAALRGAGFTAQRPYTRMRRGRGPGFGDAGLVHAIAGPELG